MNVAFEEGKSLSKEKRKNRILFYNFITKKVVDNLNRIRPFFFKLYF